MQPFTLQRATRPEEAVRLAAGGAAFLAGGTEIL